MSRPKDGGTIGETGKTWTWWITSFPGGGHGKKGFVDVFTKTYGTYASGSPSDRFPGRS